MSATIGQRNFASGPQTYLALKKDEYIRQMAIGKNWTKIRIGWLLAIDGTGDIITHDFGVGLCSYPYGFYSWNCPIWYGFSTAEAAQTLSLAYTGGTSPYYAGSHCLSRYRLAGATSAYVTDGTANSYFAANTGTPQRRTMVVLEYTKSAGNLTLDVWGSTSAAQAQLDYSYNNLLEAISYTPAVAPVILGVTTLTHWPIGSTQSIAATEATYGPWDAVSLFWNKMDYAVEIYGVAVYRYY